MSAALKVPQLHPFLNSSVILDISNGIFETTAAMAQVVCICEKSFVENKWKSPTPYSVFLDIESPPYRGRILFHFSEKSLSEIYKVIVKIEGDVPTSADLLDCLGEISNQAYGVAKGKLNVDGYSFNMTMPHPILTAELLIVESKYPSIVVPFKLYDELCYIQLVLL